MTKEDLDWIRNQAEDLKKIRNAFLNENKISIVTFYNAKTKIEESVLKRYGNSGLNSLKNLLS